jgi:hypothetical protein
MCIIELEECGMAQAHKYMAIAVVRGTARRNVGHLGPHRGDPRLHRPGDELRSLVRTDMPRHTVQDEQIGEHINDVVPP